MFFFHQSSNQTGSGKNQGNDPFLYLSHLFFRSLENSCAALSPVSWSSRPSFCFQTAKSPPPKVRMEQRENQKRHRSGRKNLKRREETGQALIDLYDATSGQSWVNNTNWNIGDPCINNWSGVNCNSGGTTVIHL